MTAIKLRRLPCGHLDMGRLRPVQCVCDWPRPRPRAAERPDPPRQLTLDEAMR